jgi:hypothetical protein
MKFGSSDCSTLDLFNIEFVTQRFEKDSHTLKYINFSMKVKIFGSTIRFPEVPGNFSLLHRIQTGSGAHPAAYPMVTGGSFPSGKATGA